MRLDVNKIIKIVNWGLLALSLFLFLCLAWIIVETLLENNWHISISMDGIKNMQNFWSEFSPLIIMFGSCLTLWIASSQLSKYINAETINALGKLRQMLNSDEKKKIHDFFLKDVGDDELQALDIDIGLLSVELLDYIGTIELGAIMLQNDVILPEQFYSQFGYRLENLWNNPIVKEHIKKNPQYYKHFLYVVDKFKL